MTKESELSQAHKFGTGKIFGMHQAFEQILSRALYAGNDFAIKEVAEALGQHYPEHPLVASWKSRNPEKPKKEEPLDCGGCEKLECAECALVEGKKILP